MNKAELLELVEKVTPSDANKLLLSAIDINSLTLVQLSIALGADATICNSLPLRQACYNGNREIADLLMEHGAKLPDDKTSLLNTAYLNDFKEILELLGQPVIR